MMSRLLSIAIVVCLFGCGISYSDGIRSGIVQKISRKGLIWKTYEGELVLDGFRFNTILDPKAGQITTTSNIWTFSVKDLEVVQGLERASISATRVKLTYQERIFIPPWDADTSYIITKCETEQNQPC